MTGCCKFVPNDINPLFMPKITPNQTKIRWKYGVLKTFPIKNRDHDHIFRDTEIPPNFHFLLHPMRQKVTGDLSRCHPPKNSEKPNKKKRRRKSGPSRKTRFSHQKECNTKTTLENRKKPGKNLTENWPDTDTSKALMVFSYVAGPEISQITGGRKFHQFEKKTPKNFLGYI